MALSPLQSPRSPLKGMGTPERMAFLHGDLDLWIYEAKSLPNMDLMSERMRKCFTMFGTCRSPFGHKSNQRNNRHAIITSDPYVSICLAGATIAQTRVIANCEDPSWEEHFHVPVAHPVSKVEFQVKDNDILGAQLIGTVSIPVQTLLSGDTIKGWFPVVGPYMKSEKQQAELYFSLHFRPFESNPLYRNGVGLAPDFVGVPNTYFPLHKGGKITLYQDAHVPHQMLPEIQLDDGRVFHQDNCWEDICHAISEAHHLIYIVGWSVYHPVRLVREPSKPLPSGGELTLGDLLKYKSAEGVRVLMLIWDDKTSHDKFLLKTVMFPPVYICFLFLPSMGFCCWKVSCKLMMKKPESFSNIQLSTVCCVLAMPAISLVVGTLFTHHQKCVLVDTQAPGNNRKITAFIGGLDLCDGRYDTPEHRLFNDLDTVYAGDFHNPTFPPVRLNAVGDYEIEIFMMVFHASVRSPRQPWHDLHCKIEGPAAYDVMKNFEQRWRKAIKWRDFRLKSVTNWHDDALLKLDRISWIVSPSTSTTEDESKLHVSEEEDPENWHVQVFRSIDSGSVKGFPKFVHEAEEKNLVCGKNLKIDKSIHSAYVKAIRSAQHFIYIENQYFVGASYYWPSYKNAGADNLVPMELALKIVSKIRAKERFVVYVVLPMWPEGAPTSGSVQEILFWQAQTMEMMYTIIAQELERTGLADEMNPQDYLNFYCLGKREPESQSEAVIQINETNVDYGKASYSSFVNLSQKYRRFMIYVHSKGMIVDDEYVLMGSANINQRSLDGSRDTEIAMGAYQPSHTWTGKQGHPHGEVYGYRMSLWAEHLGRLEDSFREPETVECARRVNQLAEQNWWAYVSEEPKVMKGHLMKYPIRVERNGRMGPIPGYEYFPDVGGKILGQHSSLPDALTT
ncbi:hypothetical protein ACLOJK_016691 [Asimina triloba]